MENKKSLNLVLCIAVSLFGHTALIGYDIPYEMRPAEALLLEQEMNEQEIQDIQEEIDIWQQGNELMHGYGEEPMFPYVEDEDGFMVPILDTSGTYENWFTGNEMLDIVEEHESVPVEELIEELEQAIQELEEINNEIDEALSRQGHGLQ